MSIRSAPPKEVKFGDVLSDSPDYTIMAIGPTNNAVRDRTWSYVRLKIGSKISGSKVGSVGGGNYLQEPHWRQKLIEIL